ncbi:MAG: phosphatase PAP2 family protein [Acholeplasmatales bacterium]|nr:phosphatase PAP2 family protein [Acholeplasmatales bacterium]
MKNISTFFNYSIVWMVLGVVLISLKSTRAVGYEIFVALTLELLICNIFVKRISKRARPFTKNDEVNLLINPPKDYSFPSGHTLCAFMCATIIAAHIFWVGVILFVVAVLVAFSRMYLYVHYPSDVFVGALMGVFIALISNQLVELLISNGWIIF